MKKTKPTVGERMIRSAKQALAFAKSKKSHGYVVHIQEKIHVKVIPKRSRSHKASLPSGSV